MINERDREIHVYDYLRVLLKWRKPAAVLLGAIVLTVIIVSFVSTPLYRATTRILIQRETPRVFNMQEFLDPSSIEFYQTQYKVIQARSVALRVVKALSLVDHPEFRVQPSKTRGTVDRKTQELRLAEALSKTYKVEPIRNSWLVDLSFESKDPRLAADIANAVAKSYILQTAETKTNTSQEAQDFLTKQIESQRKELEQSEQALQNYKEKYGIVHFSQVPGQKENEDISVQRLTGLTANLVQAQTVRMEAESRYKEVKDLLDKGAALESIPQISANYLIQQLKVQEARLDAQGSELSQKYGEKHPKMIQLRKEIEGVHQKIKTEAQQVLVSLKNEYSIARAKEGSAQAAVQAQKDQTQKLSERSIEYGVLLREVEKNRELYENLLKKLKETSVETELGTTNISVIDWAEVPRSPFKPNKMRNIALSVIVGLFCSVGLAFALEYLDNTIKTSEDIEKYMGAPCIGFIPSIDFDEQVGKGVPHPEIIVHHKPKSTVAEAFRSLRTAVLFSYPADATRSVLVSSCVPREGKTFIAANLALAMAYSGESVLLIDADMRKPQVHAIFELPNEKGLSNAIVGDEPVINRSMLHEKLDILTSGPIPPNPAELLGSKHMAELLERFKGKYKNIILDSPPLASVTDSVILARLLDGIVHVVHGGDTTRDMARRGALQLQDVDARCIGAVLNNIDIAKDNYYYSHYYDYYHYHSDYYAEDGDGERKHSGRPDRHNGRNGKHSLWALFEANALSLKNRFNVRSRNRKSDVD